MRPGGDVLVKTPRSCCCRQGDGNLGKHLERALSAWDLTFPWGPLTIQAGYVPGVPATTCWAQWHQDHRVIKPENCRGAEHPKHVFLSSGGKTHLEKGLSAANPEAESRNGALFRKETPEGTRWVKGSPPGLLHGGFNFPPGSTRTGTHTQKAPPLLSAVNIYPKMRVMPCHSWCTGPVPSPGSALQPRCVFNERDENGELRGRLLAL